MAGSNDQTQVMELEGQLRTLRTMRSERGHFEGYGGWSEGKIQEYEPQYFVCDDSEVNEGLANLEASLIDMYESTEDLRARDLAARLLNHNQHLWSQKQKYEYSRLILTIDDWSGEHPFASTFLLAGSLLTAGYGVFLLVQYIIDK